MEWAIQKYFEYRAVQSVKAVLTELEEWNRALVAEMDAKSARARREAERRRKALRDQRAKTNQGEWLAKNCAD